MCKLDTQINENEKSDAVVSSDTHRKIDRRRGRTSNGAKTISNVKRCQEGERIPKTQANIKKTKTRWICGIEHSASHEEVFSLIPEMGQFVEKYSELRRQLQ